jgi:TPP-dependent trihydroxycyclohexane-1,2-dione (THcHDO) dehydratase
MDAEAVVADAKEAISALIPALDGYITAYTTEIAAANSEWDAIVDEYYSTELEGGLNQLSLSYYQRIMGIRISLSAQLAHFPAIAAPVPPEESRHVSY